MKIIEIIPNLSSGGAERFVVDLANQLSTMKDNEVTICSLYSLKGKYNFYGASVREKIELIGLEKKLGFDVKILFKLFFLFLKKRPDIIHTHVGALNYVLPIYVFLRIFLLKKVKVLHTVHNDAFKETGTVQRKLRYYFFKWGWIKPITISKQSDDSFEIAYPNVKRKMIFNGRSFPTQSDKIQKVKEEIEQLKSNSDTLVFVNIGKIKSQKNHKRLLISFNELKNFGRNYILLIIGDYKSSSGLYEEVLLLKNEKAYFLGSKTNATDYLYFSDAFCLSSDYEGLPISLLEAMAIGSIPICTPVGGIKDVIKHGKNGLLSSEVTIEAYKEVIKNFIEKDKIERQKLSKQAKVDFIENYSIEQCSKAYFEQMKNN